MDTYVKKDFSKILKNNAHSLRHEKLSEGTNVFRIYDRNLEAFPVTVDLYSNYARVVDFGTEKMSDEVREICLDIVSRFAYIDRDKIIYLYRAKREKGQQHKKTESEPIIVNVTENNLVFKTDLASYTDSGLFLDHAKTRSFIKEHSVGMDVLNLFSYTGSFSVYAASGLAKSVTSVDLSATYTKWAQDNLALNGFEGDMFKCFCMDASKFIDDMMNKSVRYDIIIFDPPSFSNSHKMEHDFDVQRDFLYWIKRLTGLLKKDGFILFSTNLGSFKMDKRRLKGLRVKELTYSLWAEGFVKGRKGTVRSWIMSMNDDSLSLDWSEDKKSAPVKRDYKRADRPKRSYDDRGYDRPRRESSYRRRDDRSEYKRREKPYGFDSFKPARSRNDSPDFFWNSEDIKPKK